MVWPCEAPTGYGFCAAVELCLVADDIAPLFDVALTLDLPIEESVAVLVAILIFLVFEDELEPLGVLRMASDDFWLII